MFHRRWKFVGEGPMAGKVFRVVDAENKDMVAFTEWWKMPDDVGHTWRGPLTEFRRQFTMMG